MRDTQTTGSAKAHTQIRIRSVKECALPPSPGSFRKAHTRPLPAFETHVREPNIASRKPELASFRKIPIESAIANNRNFMSFTSP